MKEIFGSTAFIGALVCVWILGYLSGDKAARNCYECQPTQVYELTVRTDKFSSDLVECETLTVECSQPDGGWFRHDFAETRTSYFAPARREKSDDQSNQTRND